MSITTTRILFFSSTMRSLWNEVNVIVKYCKIGLRQFRVALKPSVPADSGFWQWKEMHNTIKTSKREFEPGTPDWNHWPSTVDLGRVGRWKSKSVFDCFTVGDLFYFLYVFMFDLNFASRMTPACPAFLHGWDHIAQIARLFGFFTQVLWNACCGKFWNVGGRWNIGCMLEYIGEYSNTLLAVLWFAWFLLKWVCCVFFGREYD